MPTVSSLIHGKTRSDHISQQQTFTKDFGKNSDFAQIIHNPSQPQNKHAFAN